MDTEIHALAAHVNPCLTHTAWNNKHTVIFYGFKYSYIIWKIIHMHFFEIMEK